MDPFRVLCRRSPTTGLSRKEVCHVGAVQVDVLYNLVTPGTSFPTPRLEEGVSEVGYSPFL